jgi:hypothetical protein
MITALQARDQIIAALTAVDGIAGASSDVSKTLVQFPSAVIQAPTFTWSGYNSSTPSNAQFNIYLVFNTTSTMVLDALAGILPAVSTALESVEQLAVTQAIPGTMVNGNVDLPCYVITTEVAL